MKERRFPLNDHKSKPDRWASYYADFDMEAYLATLDYDDVTLFLDRAVEGLHPEAAILDVGCGSGRHLVHLARRGFKNLSGIDLSDFGIRNLRQHLPQARTMVADATRLPFTSDSFDLVVMVGIVYEIPDPRHHLEVWREIHRVLKPGGKLLFVNNSPYNLGERIFTLTQAMSLAVKRTPTTFFVWRYGRRDVLDTVAKVGLSVREEWPGNIARGVFRFFYGVFVPKEVKRRRRERLQRNNGQPYELHEYYLVNRDHSLLTAPGRAVLRWSQRWCPKLFANSICYLMEKTAS